MSWEVHRAFWKQTTAPYTTVRNVDIPSTDEYRRHGMLVQAPMQKTVAGSHRWDEAE